MTYPVSWQHRTTISELSKMADHIKEVESEGGWEMVSFQVFRDLTPPKVFVVWKRPLVSTEPTPPDLEI